jgi:predicted nucleotidyltransferase
MTDSIPDMLDKFFRNNAGSLGIVMAFLYGSRSKGIPRPDSDIDLAVVFEDEGLSNEEISERLTTVSVALSDLTGLEVNLIPVYPDFRKPMLYYNAVVLGTPVFVDDPLKYLRLRNEAVRQMEDFQIFGPQWLISITRRNLEVLKHD